MARIIALANQKGGVAKTTTSCNMAAMLKRHGKKVLAVDIDPQGNLSDSIGAEMYELPTIYNLLKRDANADEAIQRMNVFDIIPANIMLAGAEQDLTQTGKEHRLREMLEPIQEQYDFIVIDTPPSLGVLTINAFTAADEIIIPTTPGIFATSGINQLYNTVLNVKKYCNNNIKIAGILLTRYNPRANINKDIKDLTEQLALHIQAPIYSTYIRNSVIVEESQANRTDVFTYKIASTVSEDYATFVDEYLEGMIMYDTEKIEV